MKKLSLLLVAALAFVSCEKHETGSWGEQQNAIAFAQTTSDVVIPNDTGMITTEVIVDVTTKSTEDRTMAINAVLESSDLPEQNYVVGTLNIPANSYNGTISIDFNNASLVDATVYLLTLKIEAAQDFIITKENGEFTSLTVAKQIVCNDLTLTILGDDYLSETTWEIVDENDAVVASGGPYSDGTAGQLEIENFNIPDGCYTFTIFDSYGDGLSFPDDGSYKLECSIITHASGVGDFGFEESAEFCVNQL
jgi:hypothetical protein